MEFKEGTSVYTIDHREAGSIQRVVIDPETNQVTDIVIQKGIFFKDDKVVPIVKVTSATEEGITLACTVEELKELPPLLIKQIKPGEEAQNFNSSMGGMFGAVPSGPEVVPETTRTIPEDLVALKEGAVVMSQDNKRVGNIERIFTDEGKVTHFTLAQGLLTKSEKSIPMEWATMVSEDEVDLSVEAQKIESLPLVQK